MNNTPFLDSQVNCICCGCILEVNIGENPFVISPVYDGLIFRSNGNYGSKIFDPMVIRSKEMLQVIICDECIRSKAKWVTRLYNIEDENIAESEKFMPDLGQLMSNSKRKRRIIRAWKRFWKWVYDNWGCPCGVDH